MHKHMHTCIHPQTLNPQTLHACAHVHVCVCVLCVCARFYRSSDLHEEAVEQTLQLQRAADICRELGNRVPSIRASNYNQGMFRLVAFRFTVLA